MEFHELLRTRRSIRDFEPRPVEAEKMRAVLEAANAAPSAGDLQAYEIVLVTDPGVRSALAAAAHEQPCMLAAPAMLVFFANPARTSGRYGCRGIELYCLQDASIACAYAQLRATDLGLGSVWVGSFEDAAVRAAVGAHERLLPVAILPIGHPAESPEPTPRRGVEDLVKLGRF
ncbi:MAG: nitroreductase family protein [Planctomycetes bacterium]|nr:nitroreductase family protein [Planctomycetota bacterium]